MRAIFRHLGVAVAALSLAACSAESASPVSSSTDFPSELRAASLPVPSAKGPDGLVGSVWTRSTVDLMVADAWSQCSFLDAPLDASGAPVAGVKAIPFTLTGSGDDYLTAMLDAMTTTLSKVGVALPKDAGPSDASPQATWLAMRRDVAKNIDPATNLGRAVRLDPNKLDAYKLTLTDAAYAPASFQASTLVGIAAMNLCIAQTVRLTGLGPDTCVFRADAGARSDRTRGLVPSRPGGSFRGTRGLVPS